MYIFNYVGTKLECNRSRKPVSSGRHLALDRKLPEATGSEKIPKVTVNKQRFEDAPSWYFIKTESSGNSIHKI